MYTTDFWTLWEKARVGWSERTASKHVYYQVWKRSPVQVECMRQMLRAGALGWPRGMGWGRRWEGGSAWGTHVNPWLIHVNIWEKPLQYCKVISLQLIKIDGKKMPHGENHRCPGRENKKKGGAGTWKILEEVKVETTLKWVKMQELEPDMEQLISS